MAMARIPGTIAIFKKHALVLQPDTHPTPYTLPHTHCHIIFMIYVHNMSALLRFGNNRSIFSSACCNLLPNPFALPSYHPASQAIQPSYHPASQQSQFQFHLQNSKGHLIYYQSNVFYPGFINLIKNFLFIFQVDLLRGQVCLNPLLKFCTLLLLISWLLKVSKNRIHWYDWI